MKANIEPHLHRALLERGVPFTRQVAERATAHMQKLERAHGSELIKDPDGNVPDLNRYVENFLEENPDVPRINLTGADRSSQHANMKRYKQSLRKSDSKSRGDAAAAKLMQKLRPHQK